MTQDEIIEMANEAGIIQPRNVIKTLEAFAKLVAQHERERCAKWCETLTFIDGTGTAEAFAEEVRNRGQA